MIGHAIDVSHHQPVGSVPFGRIANDRPTKDWQTACIVRAAYGAKPDRACVRHCQDATNAGFDHVGLYTFFRPTEPAERQARALYEQADRVDLGQAPDLVPVIDVEDDGDRLPRPEWHPFLRDLLAAVRADFGVRPMIYSTKRVWRLLGSPAWLLEYPWWLAHYTSAPAPLAPAGADLRMWQHRVGPYGGATAPGGVFGSGKGILDQNRILARLPTFGDPT
jgi:lysozyme